MKSDFKTLAARLALYEIALKDFHDTLWSGSNARKGFCCYFLVVHNINVYGAAMKEWLPELYAQKPKYSSDGKLDYWFPKEYVESRINCLHAAIQLTKTKINNEDKNIENEKSS